MSDVAIDRLGVFGSGNSNVEADELATRTVGDWHPTLPRPPAGFPGRVAGGFDLTYDEGNWLTERILDAAGGTLLSHLLEGRTAPDDGSAGPWEDTACADAPRSVLDQLRHGHLFSLGIRGAALLYNLCDPMDGHR